MRAYERQDGESTQAFEAWCVYRDWGPDRSYRAVAQWLNKSLTLIARWANRWEWQHRLQSLDDWKEMIKRDALAEEAAHKAKDIAARNAALDEELLSIKEALVPRLRQMANFPLATTTTQNDNGTQINHIYPAKWTFNTLINALSVLKESDDLNINIDLGSGPRDLSSLTDEELAQLEAIETKLASAAS